MREKFWIPVAILRWKRKFFWPTVRWAGRLSLVARRRQEPLPGQRRPQGGGERERRDRRCSGELGCLRPARARRPDDRTGWDREQRAAGRECAPGRFDGGGTRVGKDSGYPALSLSGRSRGEHAAHADDEHPERRSARRQQR